MKVVKKGKIKCGGLEKKRDTKPFTSPLKQKSTKKGDWTLDSEVLE